MSAKFNFKSKISIFFVQQSKSFVFLQVATRVAPPPTTTTTTSENEMVLRFSKESLMNQNFSRQFVSFIFRFSSNFLFGLSKMFGRKQLGLSKSSSTISRIEKQSSSHFSSLKRISTILESERSVSLRETFF